MKRIKYFVLALILTFSITGCNNTSDNKNERVVDNRDITAEEYTFLNTVGTDSLGRYFEEASSRKDGTRYVGIWYSLWLGQHTYMQSSIYDNTKLLSTAEGTQALNSLEDNNLSKMGEFHFASEPLYGYYNMEDPWVVTRHVELLTSAGIDYLCFDTTNAAVYYDVATLVIETLLKFQKQGFKVPKVMFYTNSNSGSTAGKIYSYFYQTEKYDDIWFSPNGKPLIAGITQDNNGASDQVLANPRYSDVIDPTLANRFEIVESQWPQGSIEHENSIPWMSWYYPQSIHENYKAISVSVAQHGPTINFSDKGKRSSKGYDVTTGEVETNYEAGKNFANQWQSVFNYEKEGKEINHVLLCGWNEWMAIKNEYTGAFCDVYNDEYTRDIEMYKTKSGDNFYMQMIQNIRKWKLNSKTKYKYQKMSIDISTDLSEYQWENVKAHYRDFEGDAIARCYLDAVDKETYTDNSNRNDITDIKVVHDSEYIYFYVKTKDDITAYNGTDKNWMTILIDSNSNGTGFEGYNYIINRSPSNGKTSIEKSNSGYNWESVGTGDYAVYGNQIMYKIPLSSLGLTNDNCYIKFKVTDNITNPNDIMDYYISGDSAPIGRLSYSYGY